MKSVYDILSDLTDKGPSLQEAGDKVRLRLNEVIREYDLDKATVLAILARLSAGYVYKLQEGAIDEGLKQHIEDTYYELFQAFLIFSEESAKKEKEERVKEMMREMN